MIDINKIKSAMKSGLGSGISWNMFSLIFYILSGLAQYLVIMLLYSAADLGEFTAAFAYYTAISQISVLGIHFSVLKYTSEYHRDRDARNRILTTGLLGTLGVSAAVSIVSFTAVMLLNKAWPSDMLLALLYSIPALVFFSLNKVLLGYINGLSRMTAYAVFQSLRCVFMMASLIVLALMKCPVYMLALSYLISELLLFVILAVYLSAKKLANYRYDRSWLRENMRFGWNIITGNLVQVLNVRLDVICLRFFLGGSPLIGYYSFASMAAEGFDQILFVVRRNINPLITQHYTAGDEAAFYRLYRGVRKYTRIASPPLAALLVGAVAIFFSIVPAFHEYMPALLPLSVILLSLCVNSPHVCYQNVLSQTGFPSAEARVNIIVLCANFAGNMMLIPFLGMLGASISTAVSYTVMSLMIYLLMKKHTGYRLKFMG